MGAGAVVIGMMNSSRYPYYLSGAGGSNDPKPPKKPGPPSPWWFIGGCLLAVGGTAVYLVFFAT